MFLHFRLRLQNQSVKQKYIHSELNKNLAKQTKKTLVGHALELLKTSNFHSGKEDKNSFFTLHGVQNDYRATVAGRYLVCRLQTGTKVTTPGGDIFVAEIVIGLNRDDYASSLFTINEDGAVVEHAKYSGDQCIRILQAIHKIKKGAEQE